MDKRRNQYALYRKYHPSTRSTTGSTSNTNVTSACKDKKHGQSYSDHSHIDDDNNVNNAMCSNSITTASTYTSSLSSSDTGNGNMQSGNRIDTNRPHRGPQHQTNINPTVLTPITNTEIENKRVQIKDRKLGNIERVKSNHGHSFETNPVNSRETRGVSQDSQYDFPKTKNNNELRLKQSTNLTHQQSYKKNIKNSTDLRNHPRPQSEIPESPIHNHQVMDEFTGYHPNPEIENWTTFKNINYTENQTSILRSTTKYNSDEIRNNNQVTGSPLKKVEFASTPDDNTTTQQQYESSQNHKFVHMVPTEAQLRWAQFHSKHRAKTTQIRVTNLMQTPPLLHDVEGALSCDGDSYTSYEEFSGSDSDNQHPITHDTVCSPYRHAVEKQNNSTGKKRRKKKKTSNIPPLSQGRRALLRVSKRNFEARRRHIKKNGFCKRPDIDGNESDPSEEFTLDGELSIFSGSVFQSKSNGMEGFTIRGKRKKGKVSRSGNRLKGLRSVVTNEEQEEERMRRFEEAYNTMCAFSTSTNRVESDPTHEYATSKRWTRASHIPVAVSVDGRAYDDLQRAPAIRHVTDTKRYGSNTVAAELNGIHLTDHGASWLMHLPKNDKGGNMKSIQMPNSGIYDFEGNSDDYVAPGKQKLLDIIEQLQVDEHAIDSWSSKKTISRSEMDMIKGQDIHYSNFQNLHNHDVGDFEQDSYSNSTPERSISSPFRKQLSLRTKNSNSDQLHDFTEPDLQDKIYNMVKGSNFTNQLKSSDFVIDTDNNSDLNGNIDSKDRMSSMKGTLMLSPTILQKRLRQAISAVEACQWEQVTYLVSANRWLCEMADLQSNRYLLHHIAFHGSGKTRDGQRNNPVPEALNEDVIKSFPGSVYKFDEGGNLPLHMAAQSGNVIMASKLGEMFPSGASVRNNDGLLPLHLAIMACIDAQFTNENESPAMIVKVVLDLFPGGLTIADNRGNLPLHLAANYLTKQVGVEVISILIHEIEDQGNNLRFSSPIHTMDHVGDDDDDSVGSKRSAVKSDFGSSLAQCDDLRNSILAAKNSDGQNILQIAVGKKWYDPLSVLSIIRYAPDLVSIRNSNGVLPIEVACIRGLQSKVILAIALMDLPINLHDSKSKKHHQGDSWWYLTCDCDDVHVNVVKEILELCTFAQKRDLSFAKNKAGRSVISSATPKCRLELRKALRFAGRYEFTGSIAIETESLQSHKVFEALDFGSDEEPFTDGRKVFLKYFADENSFMNTTSIVRNVNLSKNLFTDIRCFEVDSFIPNTEIPQQYCIAIERPRFTLASVVNEMNKIRENKEDDRYRRHMDKIVKILYTIGEGVNSLHQQGIVHGNISVHTCGKCESGWKVMDLLGIQYIGESFDLNRYISSPPPEAVTVSNQKVKLNSSLTADPSIDIWAFGKLLYEVFLGEILLDIDVYNPSDLKDLSNFGEQYFEDIVYKMKSSYLGALGTDLISHCLCPRQEDRPESMDFVLNHSFWKRAMNTNKKSDYSSTMNRRFEA